MFIWVKMRRKNSVFFPCVTWSIEQYRLQSERIKSNNESPNAYKFQLSRNHFHYNLIQTKNLKFCPCCKYYRRYKRTNEMPTTLVIPAIVCGQKTFRYFGITLDGDTITSCSLVLVKSWPIFCPVFGNSEVYLRGMSTREILKNKHHIREFHRKVRFIGIFSLNLNIIHNITLQILR